MNRLKINEVYFGKTDAYNEFLTYGKDVFKDLFYAYPSFKINNFLDGSIYYICGNKGTGKTMLLKYIQIISEQTPGNLTEFIRFKKDIDEEQRNQLKRAAIPQNSFEEILDQDIPANINISCVLAWEVYLIKVVIQRLSLLKSGVFLRDQNWQKLLHLIDAIYNDKDSTIKKILPKIKKGNIELNIASVAKFDVELEWIDSDKKTVSFNEVAKKIINLYSSLLVDNGKIYILIDELELSLNKNKIYERDITLIRDLIFAIQYLAEISKTKDYKVFFISAIRNEVYKNVLSKGFEINKPINDFGIQISWLQKGGNIDEHPLIQMIEQRIKSSEKAKGIKNADIWTTYFAQYIGNSNAYIKNYILDQTWYKPRDIIRLFTIMQELQGEKDFIDQAVFDTVRQQYSQESWEEFAEELRAKYTAMEVEGIRLCLTGIRLPFELKDFIAQINNKKDTFEEVDELSKGSKKPGQILRDLYDVGVIGNYPIARFSFKGDQDIDPTLPVTLHYPLLRFFKASIKALEKRYKDYI